MDRIRYFADISVKRACAFALLAIITVVVGLSSEPRMALRAAAILFSLQVFTLLLCAWRAPVTHYRRREVWILLDQFHGLPENRAQTAISGIMQDTFLGYAELSAWAAGLCWLMTFATALTLA
ncbi:MAG: hypothetical protein HQL38_14225 [Alphaproteobacteria bacterium]|nr:hypothetical protein [Alphaproteobacteria bacterium]MBF0393831.1 hypothetical protein [Alphaproteobacteria bacterium]